MLAPVLVGAYSALAVAFIPIGSLELYPFFNWSLFSRSAAQRGDVTLMIRSLNGETLERPQLLYDMKHGLVAAKRKDAILIKIIDRLWSAIKRGDQATAERLRSVIETRFLSDARSLEYDLVRIQYNPIDRLQTGDIDQIDVLASFKTGGSHN